jgi:hypothetical protein
VLNPQLNNFPRLPSLDRLRGLAVVLMFADHLLWITAPQSLLRFSITRAALPLFMIVSGWLLAGRDLPSTRRALQLVCAAVLAVMLARQLGMAQPDILVVYIVALGGWWAGRRWPAQTVAACLVLVATFPHVWRGYHPAHVLGLMCVGAILKANGSTLSAGARLPAALGWVGRWPLEFYVLHLAGLLALQRLEVI